MNLASFMFFRCLSLVSIWALWVFAVAMIIESAIPKFVVRLMSAASNDNEFVNSIIFVRVIWA
jgi:hypothetical protein